MTELQLTAPAKINLWLEIRSRRPDGYHDIERVMQTVSLCDTLTLKKADGIAVTCSNVYSSDERQSGQEIFPHRNSLPKLCLAEIAV